MGWGEDSAVGARVGVETRLRGVGYLAEATGAGGRLCVGGLEGTLAIPAITWAVLIPERITDREYRSPEHLVISAGIG